MALATARYRILGVEHAAIQKRVAGVSPNPDTVVEYDVQMINNIGFDVQQQDITFEGDNTAIRKFFLNGIVANIGADVFDLAAISSAFGKQEITTGLPTGVTGRVYFGTTEETAGVRVGFMSEVRAENTVNGATETVRITLPRTVLTIVRPPALAYNTKAPLAMTFTAEKTSQDLLGATLPSVPTGGCFWYLDRIV